MHMQRQYLYFCGSKASKLSTSVLVGALDDHPQQQYLYFCTSKASKLSTSVFVGALDDHIQLLVADWTPEALISSIGVSVVLYCTFVPVKQVLLY